MLLRFNCSNIFCFAEPCELLPIATIDTRHRNHISKSARPGAPAALRLIGIYGPNGHGKTRFIQALRVLERFVLGYDDALKKIRPFKLKKKLIDEPSKLTINYRVENIDYEYGLVATNKQVHQEWLFETKNRNEVLLFSREKSPKKPQGFNYEFGSQLKRRSSPTRGVSMEDYLRVISTGVGDKQSFLFECIEKKVTRLETAFKWFRNVLQIVDADSQYAHLQEKVSEEGEFLQSINLQLKDADTGISRLMSTTMTVDRDIAKRIPNDYPEEFRDGMKNLSDGESMSVGTDSVDGRPSMTITRKKDKFEIARLVSIHEGDMGEVEFEVFEESAGTIRLLDLYPMLHLANEREVVFVVDELDRKLHPLLTYELIRKFGEQSKGQLIFTTHTTHLLSLDLLRRDEVWLFQKHRDGHSEAYSLSDFKIRPDLDVRKGYLQGRFGAIPFAGNTHDLGWCNAD